jgi:hypothetical protein
MVQGVVHESVLTALCDLVHLHMEASKVKTGKEESELSAYWGLSEEIWAAS